MATRTAGWTTCREILAFPHHDWHGGQGSRRFHANLVTPYMPYRKWGSTNRLLDQTLPHTHKDIVLLPSLPFSIHIGTTVRTSARAPYPRPSSLPCDNIVCTVVPAQGSVTLGQLTDAVASSRGGLDLRLLAAFPASHHASHSLPIILGDLMCSQATVGSK